MELKSDYTEMIQIPNSQHFSIGIFPKKTHKTHAGDLVTAALTSGSYDLQQVGTNLCSILAW